MLHQLETGSCRDVVWIDKEMGKFKIPWYHINKIECKEIPEKFEIFVEWAKFTGKYKDGDKPDYSKFKTQLRTAMTKLEDFIEVPKEDEVYKSQVEPCRIFQFSDWDSASCYRVSPDSTVVCDDEVHLLKQSRAQRQLFQDDAPNLPKFLQQLGANLQSDVDGQITDKNSCFPPTHSNNALGIGDPNCTNLDQKQYEANSFMTKEIIKDQSYASDPLWKQQVPGNQQGNLHFDDVLHEAMKQSEIPVSSTFVHNADEQFDMKKEEVTQEDPFSDSYNLTPSAFHQSELMQWCLMDEGQPNQQAPNAESEKCNLTLPPDLESIPYHDLIPAHPPYDSATTDECKGACSPRLDATPSEADHQMTIILSYGRPTTKVMEKNVSARGCRLFFKERVFDKGFIEYKNMYGSENVEQLEMPPVENYPRNNEKAKAIISTTLDAMTRGIILTFQNGDIYADRKCRCNIFTCDSDLNSQLIKRSRDGTNQQKVFDYEKFKESLKKGKRQDPYFILTFGQNITGRGSALEKILVYAYVYHKNALKQAADHNPQLSSLSSLEPILSDSNTLDKLEQKFREMSTNVNDQIVD